MKKLWSVLAPLLLLACFSFSQAQKKSSYWVNKNIDWNNPSTGDAEIDALVEASTVNAIIFHPNGQFRMLSCNGSLGQDTISQHSGIYKAFHGIWKQDSNGDIELTYNLDISYSLINTNKVYNTQPKTVKLDLRKPEFKFEGIRYVKGSTLSQRTKERLQNLATQSKSKKK